MNDTDDRIRAALNQENEDEALLSMDRGLEMREVLVTSFQGKMRFWTIFVYIYLLIFMVSTVFCTLWFFQSDTVKDMILYAALACLSMMVIVVVKLWYWMLINRNAITREVKRLELQIARLTERLAE